MALTPRGRHSRSFVLGLIVLVALTLRAIHLGWALPYTYEEAKPLQVAFQMWGWDRGGAVDLNPHFFNYPSLVLYIHFVAQGLLFLVLKLTGSISSIMDWQVLYLTDPSIIYLVERAVSVVFAVGTVCLTATLGRLMAGWLAGMIAALFLALNSFHIAQSQVIEVDVPLTFFTTLALVGVVRVVQDGRRRDYVLAGIAAGLAASCKYTGFFLIVPLVVGHLLGRRGARPVRDLLIAVALVGAVFAATSPFVLIDFKKFWGDLATERAHMATGHFGLSQAPTWTFYARALAGGVVSLPITLLGVVGAAFLVARAKNRSAMAVLAFTVVFLVILSSWKMRADRYLSPVLPAVLVLAAAPLAAVASWNGGRKVPVRIAAALAVVALCAVDLGGYARSQNERHYDARTEATRWIESHVAGGAFIVTERYGPSLITPSFLLQLHPALREKVIARLGRRPVYAVQTLPMAQTEPERSAPFYSLDLYPCADYVIVSSWIRERYEHEPARFSEQLRFYARLDADMRPVRDFTSPDGTGVRLTLFERTRDHSRFAQADSVPPPPDLFRDPKSGGWQASFYHELGTDYEYFGHARDAYVCYVRAMERGPGSSLLFLHCTLGMVRTLLSTGQTETAIHVLERISRVAPDDATRRRVDAMRHLVERGATP